MKKYIFLLFVFTLGVYAVTVVHASPTITKHELAVITPYLDDVGVVAVDVVTPTIGIPVLMVVDLPVQCLNLENGVQPPRIRWKHLGNNYHQNHPPSIKNLVITKQHSYLHYRC